MLEHFPRLIHQPCCVQFARNDRRIRESFPLEMLSHFRKRNSHQGESRLQSFSNIIIYVFCFTVGVGIRCGNAKHDHLHRKLFANFTSEKLAVTLTTLSRPTQTVGFFFKSHKRIHAIRGKLFCSTVLHMMK